MMLLCVTACAPPPPRTIPRVVDGRIEHGPVVPAYAYAWFLEGELAAAKGDHEQSALALETALAAPIDDVLVLSKLAVEYQLSDEPRRAARTLASANRLYPDSIEVALARGELLRASGATDAAMASFQRARRINPQADEPVVAIAELLDASGRPLRAEGLLQEYVQTSAAVSSHGARRLWLDLARREADAESLALALSTTGTPNGREAAELALEHGQPATAARILSDALGATEQNTLWVKAMLRSGRVEEAVELLSTSNSDAFGGRVAHAELLIAARQLGRALEVLEPEPGSPRVQYLRGHARLGMDDYVGAVRLLAEVPWGSADFELARADLADALIALGRPGASAESLGFSESDTLALRMKRAEAYRTSGNLRAALALFDPARPRERAAMALLYERAGLFEEAAAHYSRTDAAKLSEPRTRAVAGAERLAATGRKRGAVAILRRWTRAAPEDFYARMRLVQLLRDLGETDQARVEALELLPLAQDLLLQSQLLSLLDELG
jgi:hypothetical protein